MRFFSAKAQRVNKTVHIEIDARLYQQYQNLLKERFRTTDSAQAIQRLIEQELRKHRAPGYDADPLTGSKTRYQLEFDIQQAVMGKGWQDESIFENRYLCIDIDNFKSYLDHNGIAPGDNVLKDVADQLQKDYPACNVYRYGGDEFVVELGGEAIVPLPGNLPVTLKHSVVSVTLKRDTRIRWFLSTAILYHLEKGFMEATPKGTEIMFCYPEPDSD